MSGAIEAWVDGNAARRPSPTDPPEKASPAATPQPNDIKNPKTLTVKLHYYRVDGRLPGLRAWSPTPGKAGICGAWYAESTSGMAIPEFNGHDDFGEVAEYTLSPNRQRRA
ncbi:MAG: hypothetical protein ACLRG3_00870 [Bifidobacterium adolescentis]